jgi:hypothetical protein
LNGSSFNCTQTLVAGTNNIQVQAVDVAGNASSTTASVAFVKPPQITITSPVSSSLFNQSPINVTGTVVDPGAHVLVNGIAAPVSGNSFLATVPAQEGISTITAVVTNSDGSTDTASVQINLDTTPPHVAIYAPLDGSVTPDGSVTVTGLVNDIVVGTVNPQQATVKVNGVSAQVANRSFSVSNIPLTVGPNLIHATAVDAAGNEATATITIMRQAAGQPAVKVFSGNNQSGTINSPLQQPLVAQVVNASGQPVASVPVVFRVTAQNGTLGTTNPGLSDIAVNTDAQGLASVPFTLGSHAGAGNNLVEASTTGVPATAVFSASASSTGATLINVDSGNNQFGVVGQSLPLPFIAVVTDAGHNRIPGVPVTFTVKQGAGNINGQSSVTLNSDGDGRVQVVLTLGPDAGINNNLLEATFPGNAAFPASFTATARTQGPAAATAISGVVLDNSNQPIPGVTMRLFQLNQGPSGNLPQQVGTPVVTDGEGQFTIQPAPVGVFKLMADGGTATRPGVWPTLEYDIITTPGQNNTVGSPIYLPQLNPDNKLCVTPSTGGTLTVPQVPGFSLTIAPGSATFPGGSHTGCVTVTPVNMDKVPMVPGFGQQPRFVVTIQPVGTMFNPPAAMTIPNVDGLAPRAVTEMYSYDHDLASFVAIGTATVSDDGSVIKSDPGVGVLKAGWHCGGDPNANGTVADCPTCRLCLNNSCANVDPAQDQKICTTASIPTGVCKTGDCVPITAKVTQVTYSGGSFHGVSKDNGTAYGSPQWTDSGDHFPVSYTSNNTVTVTATFKLSNSLSSGAVQVTGDATGGLQFQGAGTLAGDTVTLPATASTQTLANSIKKISPFQIQWKLTIDGKDVPAGASANDLYVTLHDPVASPLYETLLVIAGRTADGVTADSAAATAIWGDFQHTASGVTRADGVGMVYWHLGVAPDACQTLAGMLAPLGAGDPNNGNGSCKAWSQLLQGTYFAQGITPSASILQITADTTVNPNSAGFLVRNWNFGKHVRTGADGIRHTAVAGDDEEVFPVGQGLPNVPCVAPGTGQPLVAHASGDDTVIAGKITTGADGICNTTAAGTDVQLIAVGKGAAGSVCIGPGPDGTLNSTPSGGDTANDGVFTGLYPYLVGFDARDQLGIPGQGNPDPPGAFFNHFVVSYSGQIYDPSYGAGPFSTQLAHENAAAAGIFAITSGSTIAKKKAATKELDYN